MRSRIFIVRAFGILVCVLAIFYIQQKVKFAGRFEHLLWFEDWQCVPLWYPYFMYKAIDDVRLGNIERWGDGSNGSTLKVRDEMQLAEWLLQENVEGVKEFCIRDGVLVGKRMVNVKSLDFFFPSMCARTNYVAYFVFATNMEKAVQFSSIDAYLEKCKEYGVAGDSLKSFDENFKDHEVLCDATSGFPNIVRTNFAAGVSVGEWMFYVACAIVSFFVLLWYQSRLF